ncbi:MAG: Uma2 family endonuclease [Acidimicrobiales bacterium]
MKAVMLEVPKALLEERRRLGHDRFDEMWDGVLHMVPPGLSWHFQFATELLLVLGPIAKQRGLVPFHEVGFYRHTKDYRVPDLAFAAQDNIVRRGIEGGVPLVVEIRSKHDETDEKVPWYLAQGVAEVLVIHPDTRAVELFTAAGRTAGTVDVATLGVRLEVVNGPRLRLTWDGGSAEI